eukprot:CAMPEP_0176452370 /NCGR_PEP_ID=MMETSP0127-20121128/28494_1 /TAXON_ID=938130 /ORGANISM="Platyophrya macrostoma, Strain WH" /LENGTH=125 /DNA_ID=CAMNT_0017840809 /DNA_START=25 /DNA_END=398 /DNA_ORIENTATION=-
MELRLANVNGALNFSPTLAPMEAHRVVAAFEKAIERLQLLTLLNYESAGEATANATLGKKGTSAASTLKDKSRGEDKGVGALLDEQKRLEARYEQLLVATKKVHANPLDPALDAQCFAHVENPDR